MTTQTGSTITGVVTVRRTPNVLLALVLFMLCIVPLVVYLIVSSRGDTYGWSVQVTPHGAGSSVAFTAQGAAGPLIHDALSVLPEA